MAISENSKTVFTYLQAHAGDDLTAADVAEATGIPKKSVDCIFTAAIKNKGYGVRIPAEMEMEDGSHKAIKLLKLTDEGKSVDIETL